MIHKFSKNLVCKAILISVITFTFGGGAHGGILLPSDSNKITAQLQKNGFASVRVQLVKSTLDDLAANAGQIQINSQKKGEDIIKILGAEALPEGQEISPIGSLDVLVTSRGLDILKYNNEIFSITPGIEWNNSLLSDGDGSLTAINSKLEAEGNVTIDVYFNIENASFTINKTTGKSDLLLTKSQQQDAIVKAANTLTRLGFESVKKSSKSKSNPGVGIIDTDQLAETGKITMQVDRRALHALSRDRSVLTIKPTGFVDSKSFAFDNSVYEQAKSNNGLAKVIIQFRMPFFSGHVNDSTQKVHNKAVEGLMKDALSGLNAKNIKLFPITGTAIAHLDDADLKKLSDSTDKRLYEVMANKPMYNISLATSTSTIGMGAVWSSNLKGSGQTIWIFDTGIQKDHLMLKNSSGSSRVVAEACFQTNDSDYYSTCNPGSPGQPGDSFAAGSGQPFSQVQCGSNTEFKLNICSHGTHVAGIAAGRYSATNPSVQGMAPEANIASVQVTSRSRIGDLTTTTPADVIEAINILANIAPAGGIYPAVVNMSLGGIESNSPQQWNYGTLSTYLAVLDLKNKGIPVVAAMGNGNQNWGIHMPASVDNVIKVGSLNNDGFGTTINSDNTNNRNNSGTNRTRKANFPNQTFFFAPGVFIKSSVVDYATNSAIGSVGGTSMATPHVSGLYAVVKSALPTYTVDQVTAWIDQNFSYTIYINACQAEYFIGCTNNESFKAIGYLRS